MEQCGSLAGFSGCPGDLCLLRRVELISKIEHCGSPEIKMWSKRLQGVISALRYKQCDLHMPTLCLLQVMFSDIERHNFSLKKIDIRIVLGASGGT